METPERIGEFRILRVLGQGGMGIVYEAEQESLNRRVALKVLPRGALRDRNQLKRFEIESRSAARLQHSNIVPVYGVGEYEGTHFYAMQFIEGQGLDQVLVELRLIRQMRRSESASQDELGKDPTNRFSGESASAAAIALSLYPNPFTVVDCGTLAERSPASHFPGLPEQWTPLAPVLDASKLDGIVSSQASALVSVTGETDRRYARMVAGIGIQVAEALSHAHHHGIMHRDIKPSNLLLDREGKVWVTDFGLAKAKGSVDLTGTGDIIGTVRYMAPERFRGAGDARSDIYSLGLTLYELLALRPAFNETEHAKLVHLVANEPPVRLRKLNRAVPLDLETIVHKAIAVEPNQRYQTAVALADDLNRFRDGRPILARRVSMVQQIWRWSRRNPFFAAALFTAVISLVTMAVGSSVYAISQARAKDRVKQLFNESRNLSLALKRSLMESDRRLAELNLERGQAACEKGELGLGLLWMTESWRLAIKAGDQPLQQAARGSIAAWQGQYPRLRAIFSHGGGVSPGAVAFSPDGRTVVTGSYDNTARLWDTTTGLPSGAELRHQSSVRVVAFAPDGASVLTGDDEGTMRVWDVKSGAVLREFPRQGGMISSLVFSFDGKRILTGSADQTARLWDVATGKPLGPLLVHHGAVEAVSLSPDARVALTGSKDKTARLWNPVSGEPLAAPLEHPGSVSAVAFSPDGKSVLTGGGNWGRVWDAATGKARTEPLLHQGSVLAVAYSGDCKTVLTGSSDSTARLWDAATGEPVGSPLHHGDVVSAVAFSPDSRMALTGSRDHTARVWDAATGEILDLPRHHRAAVQSVAFSPDGKTIVTGSMDGTARLWNALTKRPLPLILRHQGEVRSVAFSPDGKTALTGCNDRTVRLWDVATGRPKGIFEMSNTVSVIAYSPDGTKVLAADVDGTIKLWNPTTLRPEGRVLKHPARVDSAAFSPDGARVLSGGWDGTARLWEIQSGRQIGDPLKHDGAITAVAFNKGGTIVVTASGDNTARLWDLASGSMHGLPLQHRQRVLAVAFSPDGALLLTGSGDNTARLWDVATGQPVGSPMKHDGGVLVVAFSPNGQTILTGSDDNSARLWDVITGQPVGSPLKHAGPIQAAAFSRDSQTVLTGSADKRARLWGAASGQPLGPALEHEGSVYSVTFSPDGHVFLTGSADGAARLWSLPNLPDDEHRIAAWVEVLTGLELVGADRIRVMDGQDWLERRAALRRQGGGPKVHTPWQLDLLLPGSDPLARPRAWIKRGRWAEAEATLDEAVAARPFDTAIFIERARFLLDRNRPEAAESDFARAYALGYRDPALESLILASDSLFQRVVAASPEMAASLYAMRASSRIEKQLWSDAEADLSRALQLEPNEPKYWIERGLLFARGADSMRAAADFGRACRLLPDDMLLAAQQMILLADAGELSQLRQGAEHLMDRTGQATSPDVACFLALALMQNPGSTIDWAAVIRLGRLAVSKNSANACYHHVLAGALLRAGEYSEALDELDRSDHAAEKWQARELNDAMRPLVLHKLGRDRESRAALEALRRRSPQSPGTTPFGRWASEWWWWYHFRALRREAEATVLFDPVFPPDPFAP